MTRLEPYKKVLRDLAIRSKNKCAFPECDHPILNPQGDYIAELCHIEAAELGGPRYNSNQSDEDRRAYSNLLFMCHSHHKETDDESLFPVARLQKIKDDHEALPEVVFNHKLLLQKIEDVSSEQAKLLEFVRSEKSGVPAAISFPIVGPWIREAWTPEDGRFYESQNKIGPRFKFILKDGWLHIEQTLPDGAVAYYEVNEQGSVRNSKFPYPINEYHVEIPKSMVLSQEPVPSSLGTRAVRTILKWSAGTVVEHFQGNIFVGADCKARCIVNHKTRTINIMEPKSTI